MKIKALPPAEMEGWMQGWDEQLHCAEKHMLLISNMILG